MHRGLDPVHIVERLLEIVERTALNAAHGTLDAAVTGHDDDLDLGTRALDLLEQVEAAAPTQLQIDQRHVEARIRQKRLRGLRGICERSFVTGSLQGPLKRSEQQLLVIDQEDEASGLGLRGLVARTPVHARGCHALRIGSEIETLE